MFCKPVNRLGKSRPYVPVRAIDLSEFAHENEATVIVATVWGHLVGGEQPGKQKINSASFYLTQNKDKYLQFSIRLYQFVSYYSN